MAEMKCTRQQREEDPFYPSFSQTMPGYANTAFAGKSAVSLLRNLFFLHLIINSVTSKPYVHIPLQHRVVIRGSAPVSSSAISAEQTSTHF